MSRKANPTLIGAFIVLGTALAITALLIFGSGTLFRKSEPFLLYFEDSVNGLAVGAPVKFKGVDIGRVTNIRIHYDQPAHSDAIPVFIEIDADEKERRPELTAMLEHLTDPLKLSVQIKEGLRAKLEPQSYVTGLLYIELDYYKGTRYELLQLGDTFREIPTRSSGLQALWKSASTTLANLSAIDFPKISKELHGTLYEVRTGLQAVDFQALNDELLSAMRSLEQILASDQLKRILDSTEGTLASVDRFANTLADEIGPLTQEAQLALADLRAALESVDSALSPEAPVRYELTSMLEETRRALQSLRSLTDYLERNPDALLKGRHTDED